MGFRFFVLNTLFIAAFSLLGFNLYTLQVEQADYYFNKVEARNDYLKNSQMRRGEILFKDKFGNTIPAAINKDFPIAYAVPKEIESPDVVAKKLAMIFDRSAEKLEKSFSNKESLFYLLGEKITNEQVKAVNDLDIQGLYIDEKKFRFYPFEDLAASTVGFVGLNQKHDRPTGLYGLESLYDGKLSNEEDIQLTVDRNLQAESENVLSDLIEEFDASGGAVIIQKPETGEIMAMVNKPEFDPNNYSEYPIKNFINDAVQYVYEAGSVFKPITMAIGIDLGVITPATTYVDKGEVTYNGKTIKNWDEKAYGRITMTKVIERSINTGAVFAAFEIGLENFLNYLEKFGFGSKTDIDLPNESAGSLNNLQSNNVRDIELATAAFGQGTAVTPIQLVNAYSAIANGGVLMEPFVTREKEKKVKRRVVSEEAAEQVTGMMESAVEKAIVAHIPGYGIAGKTGTAQVPDFIHGGYGDKYIHTFVGFGPTSDPQFTILIKLDEPQVDLAGFTVVPAFKKLAQFTINYLDIPPDNLTNNQ